MRTAIVPVTRHSACPSSQLLPQAFAGLPRIDGVPSRMSLRPERAEWANLALWCDEAGLVKANHWKRAYNAEETVLTALGDWTTETGRLAHLACSFSIEIAEGMCHADHGWKDILAERGQDSGKPHLAVSMWPAGPNPNLFIGNVMLALEKECPGLASTTLEAIRYAAIRTIDVIDPARTIGIASWMYWYGASDETAALEEMDGDVDEDYLVRRADFDEHAPEWAWFPRKRLSNRALSGIAKDASMSERARRVAEACLSVAKFRSKTDLLSAYWGLHSLDFVGIGARLWWADSDNCPMVRVWDDFEANAMQGGEEHSESFGIDSFEASQAGFNGWLKHKQQWFDLARRLDTLIGLVGEEII